MVVSTVGTADEKLNCQLLQREVKLFLILVGTHSYPKTLAAPSFQILSVHLDWPYFYWFFANCGSLNMCTGCLCEIALCSVRLCWCMVWFISHLICFIRTQPPTRHHTFLSRGLQPPLLCTNRCFSFSFLLLLCFSLCEPCRKLAYSFLWTPAFTKDYNNNPIINLRGAL